MKRALILISAVLLSAVVMASPDGTVYGKGVTLDQPVAVESLLAHPDAYLGKQIRVDGVVTGVCKMRGCWIQVSDPATGKGVRIKVEDGVIVFPPESVGHKISAQGVFEAQAAPAGLTGPGEAAAEGPTCERETGIKLGGATCDEPDEPQGKASVVYQIAGTGAVIY